MRDHKNWIGYMPGGTGPVEMRKGKRVVYAGDPNVVFLGRSHWWLVHLTGRE